MISDSSDGLIEDLEIPPAPFRKGGVFFRGWEFDMENSPLKRGVGGCYSGFVGGNAVGCWWVGLEIPLAPFRKGGVFFSGLGV